MFFVYSLIDPRNLRVRYVGMSKNPRKRLLMHVRPSNVHKEIHTGNKHKGSWIKQLLDAGMQPIQVITEACETLADVIAAEKFWIKLFSSLECPLVNKTTGGEGVPGYVPTEATKNKISENTRAAMRCPIIREKIRESAKGRFGGMNGKTQSPEARLKMSIAKKGKIPAIAKTGHTEACKKRMSEIAKKSFANGRTTRAGIGHSDKTKQTLREAHGVRLQDQFGNQYLSINEAHQKTKIARKTIRRMLDGTLGEKKGYRFTYVPRT